MRAAEKMEEREAAARRGGSRGSPGQVRLTAVWGQGGAAAQM
jgi:hypothetical protein